MTPPSVEKSKPRKPSKLEIANELYKFAFQVKLQKFKEKHPTSSAEEIARLTKQYFLNLKETSK